MKCKYKCDDFTTYSSMTMAGYILSQCSPEDIITTWFNLIDTTPTLYNDDTIIGEFYLNNLLFMYRNNILADKIHDVAFDFVDKGKSQDEKIKFLKVLFGNFTYLSKLTYSLVFFLNPP